MSAAYIGCAGWTVRKDLQPDFPGEGSHLERYAARFNAVEINSSFHRPHRQKTYARWAASVPEEFAFSVKVPKAITHENRLVACEALLDQLADETNGLGAKLRCVLIQLPPSFAFEADVAEEFLAQARARFQMTAALEARHASWFTAEASAVLDRYAVSRVIADPEVVPCTEPAGTVGYFRMHGSPRVYYSAYERERLIQLASEMKAFAASGKPVWAIFDNTALGHAVSNALELGALIGANRNRVLS